MWALSNEFHDESHSDVTHFVDLSTSQCSQFLKICSSSPSGFPAMFAAVFELVVHVYTCIWQKSARLRECDAFRDVNEDF